MEDVDLSHWDLTHYFKPYELACLLVGLEPIDLPLPREATPGMRAVQRAYETALSYVYANVYDYGDDGSGGASLTDYLESRTSKSWFRLGGAIKGGYALEVIVNDLGSPINMHDVWAWYTGEKSEFDVQTFDRADVIAWLKRNPHIKSKYRFDREGGKHKIGNLWPIPDATARPVRTVDAEMEDLDLSNWDLTERFTGVELACLLVGVAPDDPYNPRVKPAEKRILDALEQFREMVYEVGRLNDGPQTFTGVQLICRSAKSSVRVSFSAGNTIFEDLCGYAKTWATHEAGDLFKEEFDRQDVVAWLKYTGLKSKYQFDLGASDVELPSAPSEKPGPPNPPSAPADAPQAADVPLEPWLNPRKSGFNIETQRRWVREFDEFRPPPSTTAKEPKHGAVAEISRRQAALSGGRPTSVRKHIEQVIEAYIKHTQKKN